MIQWERSNKAGFKHKPIWASAAPATKEWTSTPQKLAYLLFGAVKFNNSALQKVLRWVQVFGSCNLLATALVLNSPSQNPGPKTHTHLKEILQTAFQNNCYIFRVSHNLMFRTSNSTLLPNVCGLQMLDCEFSLYCVYGLLDLVRGWAPCVGSWLEKAGISGTFWQFSWWMK